MSIYATNPGKYRHRVTIERQVEGQDPSDGSPTVEWALVQAGVPAEVLTGPGRETIAANAQQAETTARINLRWFPGLDQSDRILWDSKVYNIKSLETDSTGRREWRATCSDGLNDGR